MYNAAAETLPWQNRVAADDQAYRAQISYLFERSMFYRDKLTAAGFVQASDVGGLADIASLPFTEKDELRASRSAHAPIGTYLAAAEEEVVRIYSTSGTTGTPSYIPLTARDLADWVEISSRSYSASGLRRGDRIITTYGAGPFVAGATLDAFNALGLCHIPVGAGNTERLLAAIENLKPNIIALTPSYALHLAEVARNRGMNLAASSVERLLVAGEPGGGEPAIRDGLQSAWGAQVTEAMGIGDVAVSLWGECRHRQGMHFSGRGIVHVELVDPDDGKSIRFEDGAEGELVYTHIRRQAVPLLRFRSRDHVRVSMDPCGCGRTAPRVRCIGRTDDMLIVRGVNVFPSAVREVVNSFSPKVSGVIMIQPQHRAVRQSPPLPVLVELAKDAAADVDLSNAIAARIRDNLVFAADIRLAAHGSLPRSDYKSKLVDWSHASPEGSGQ